jgi:hypothetical protein
VQALNATRLAPSAIPLGNLGRRAGYLLPFVPIDDTLDADEPSDAP